MANIILPQVNILNEINDSATMLVEQNGEINRFNIADLDIGGGDVTINLEDSNISKPNPVNADTLGGRSPEEYIALANDYTNQQVKKAAPRNLLDNSDFTNPVNQRGQTSYSLGAWGGYTIDRWTVSGDGAMVTLTPNGLQLYGGLYQPIIEYDRLSGKTVTLAAKVNGEVICCSGTVTYTGEWHRVTEFGSEALQAFISVDAVVETELLWVTIAALNATFEWIAFYEGEYTADTLPKYQPKGYANELLACNVTDTGNMSGMELLWENASPTSNFAAQTISLDLSKYDLVKIEFYHATGSNIQFGHLSTIPGRTWGTAIVGYVYQRIATVEQEGVTFGGGVYYPNYGSTTSSAQDNAIIPYRIYGIKGVSV